MFNRQGVSNIYKVIFGSNSDAEEGFKTFFDEENQLEKSGFIYENRQNIPTQFTFGKNEGILVALLKMIEELQGKVSNLDAYSKDMWNTLNHPKPVAVKPKKLSTKKTVKKTAKK